jgi:hypothetical protein
MTSFPSQDESNNSESLSTAIVDTLAEAKGVDPLELDPLYDVVDPDALDALFSPSDESDDSRFGRVTFRTSGYEVEATSTGRVHVTRLEALEAE